MQTQIWPTNQWGLSSDANVQLTLPNKASLFTLHNSVTNCLVTNYHRGMLNERLKNLRLAKGMTLQQVGDVFAISKASVSSWESGKSNPDHKKLEKLAELFETSVQFLISGISPQFLF